jgi:hypothetical protein
MNAGKVAVVNFSSDLDDTDVNAIIGACQAQLDEDVVPAWFAGAMSFGVMPKGSHIPPGMAGLGFFDTSDQADALAYHELTVDGLPLSKIFVKTTLENGGLVSVSASHEAVEMGVDPWLAAAYQISAKRWAAAELCDPCEADVQAYLKGGVPVSNFILPGWYRVRHTGKVDHLGLCKGPLDILAGGYAQFWEQRRGWWAEFGPNLPARSFAKHQLSKVQMLSELGETVRARTVVNPETRSERILLGLHDPARLSAYPVAP